MPYSTLVERTVSKSKSEVYALFADIGKIHEILPGTAARAEVRGEGIGSTRTVELNPESGFSGLVTERVDGLIEPHAFVYSIVGESPMPWRDYVSVVHFADAGDGGCHITYTANWTPHDLPAEQANAILTNFYNLILDGVENYPGS